MWSGAPTTSTSAPASCISAADSSALCPPPTTSTRRPAKTRQVPVLGRVRDELARQARGDGRPVGEVGDAAAPRRPGAPAAGRRRPGRAGTRPRRARPGSTGRRSTSGATCRCTQVAVVDEARPAGPGRANRLAGLGAVAVQRQRAVVLGDARRRPVRAQQHAVGHRAPERHRVAAQSHLYAGAAQVRRGREAVGACSGTTADALSVSSMRAAAAISQEPGMDDSAGPAAASPKRSRRTLSASFSRPELAGRTPKRRTGPSPAAGPAMPFGLPLVGWSPLGFEPRLNRF